MRYKINVFDILEDPQIDIKLGRACKHIVLKTTSDDERWHKFGEFLFNTRLYFLSCGVLIGQITVNKNRKKTIKN